jgi:hypothetical protein
MVLAVEAAEALVAVAARMTMAARSVMSARMDFSSLTADLLSPQGAVYGPSSRETAVAATRGVCSALHRAGGC